MRQLQSDSINYWMVFTCVSQPFLFSARTHRSSSVPGTNGLESPLSHHQQVTWTTGQYIISCCTSIALNTSLSVPAHSMWTTHPCLRVWQCSNWLLMNAPHTEWTNNSFIQVIHGYLGRVEHMPQLTTSVYPDFWGRSVVVLFTVRRKVYKLEHIFKVFIFTSHCRP